MIWLRPTLNGWQKYNQSPSEPHPMHHPQMHQSKEPTSALPPHASFTCCSCCLKCSPQNLVIFGKSFLVPPERTWSPTFRLPKLPFKAPGQSSWMITVYLSAIFIRLRTTWGHTLSSLDAPTPDPGPVDSRHSLNVRWIGDLTQHHSFSKRRQESWHQDCKWQPSFGMKAEHTFIKDRSTAEDEDGEGFFF